MVARAIEITEHLQHLKTGLTVDELRLQTGYSRSTVYRILTTLAAYGYAQREPQHGEYRWTIPPKK